MHIILQKTKKDKTARRVTYGRGVVIHGDREWKREGRHMYLTDKGLERGKKYVSVYQYSDGAIVARLGRFAYAWGATDNRYSDGEAGTIRKAADTDVALMERARERVEQAQRDYADIVAASWRRAKPILWHEAEEVIREAGFEVKDHAGDHEPIVT